MRKIICGFFIFIAIACMFRVCVLGKTTKPDFYAYVNSIENIDGYFDDIQTKIFSYANQYKSSSTDYLNSLAQNKYIPEWIANFGSFLVNMLSSIILVAGYSVSLVSYLAQFITAFVTILFV